MAIVLLLLTMVGCSNGVNSSSAAPEDDKSVASATTSDTATSSNTDGVTVKSTDGEPLKLAIVSGWLSWLEPQMEKFMADTRHEVEIVEIMVGADMYTKITMMLQSGQTAPDVLTEDGFMINSDAAAGYLEPLDDFVSGNPDIENYIEAIMEGGKGADGVQYGIPLSTDVQGIWYDTELFKSAGLPVPFEPSTWAEILEAAKTLREANTDNEDFIPIYMYASKTHPEETSMRTFQHLFNATGGTLYEAETYSWVVEEENMMLVFDFINDVFNVEQVGPYPSYITQQTIADLMKSDLLKNGKVGMYFSGSWERSSWNTGADYEWPEGKDRIDYAMLPTVDGRAPGYSTVSGGWTWAIPANSSNKEGAKELLAYVTSFDVNKSFLMTYADLSTRRDVAADEDYLSQEMTPVEQSNKMMEYTHFRPSVDGYAAVTLLYTEVVENIALSGGTPEDALDTMKSELIRIMGEDRVIVR